MNAGIAELVGTDAARIVASASARLVVGGAAAASVANDIYGDGHAAERIADLAFWFMHNRSAPPPHAPVDNAAAAATFDLVIVFTV